MRILERMVSIPIGNHRMRMWVKASDLRDIDEENEQRKQIGDALLACVTAQHDVLQMLDALAALPFCNAVEILDGSGQGFLIYPEWP